MQNLEIKARYAHFEHARACVRELGGRFAGRMQQSDTYFNARSGRLKLRMIDGKQGQLIHYQRTDTKAPRPSDYAIYESDNPQQLERLLADALGVQCRVRKSRELHMIDNVRVHLDSVEDLGNFLEFEAVMDAGRTQQQEMEKLQRYIHMFRIQPEMLVAASYLDLMLGLNRE